MSTPARRFAGIYVAVVAAGFGLSTLVTYAVARDDSFVASVLDAAFILVGVLAVEAWSVRARRRDAATVSVTMTFVFGDIEDSTGLLRSLGDGYGGLLVAYQRVVRRAAEEHRGHVVDSEGDGFFLAFPAAGDALTASTTVQESLSAAAWPHGIAPAVRIGIHSGRATTVGGRYVGLPVHRASRICGVARGGQILVSESSRSLMVDDGLPAELELRDLGDRELKGLDRPVRVYEVVPSTSPAMARVPNPDAAVRPMEDRT
jgi:class 3 adenylate cyclase